ncbi:hypothetical protein CH276_13230 [Rhodococcus sp. 06-470-2]|uniref:hypothetical protein n=1 Tax=unclassified Rhodococcus (in: high G+C Gram-positive bacteria) TaxID=192944 RepID=UPI000B9A6EA9|nr:MULTISPECIES: hypothetical protein [unclassified Rhodococcus (in: high G+C Gram-positive bacteria)]OZC63299.1 hypothetical protein CH276_13230 [Rhodococcus sp. 06-470-2]OZE61321.1 hypothetical protein CH265_18505 [Rhodococcus sp. 05-2221-1B]
MDQVYARLKRLRRAPFRRVISGTKLFDVDVPESGFCVEYDPSTLLDDDEWFKISDFREREFFLNILDDNDLVSADMAELAKNQFGNISFLMSVQDENYFFQRVRPSVLLRRKSIVFGDVAFLEEPSNRIIVNPLPDAIFAPESDILLFRDLAAVSPIFPGIDALYRLATDEQVQAFLNSDFINSNIRPADVSKPNRKRIALAIDSLGLMSSAEQKSVLSYISEYSEGKLSLDPKSGTFNVSNDEELKILVYGIEQRFYTTMVGKEKRLANSIVKIS